MTLGQTYASRVYHIRTPASARGVSGGRHECLHNVSRNKDGDFVEEDHLGGDIDMYGVMKALVLEQKHREGGGAKRRRIPFRPDHGHLMIPDAGKQGVYPGYSLFGRMRGLAEMRTLELGIRRSLGM